MMPPLSPALRWPPSGGPVTPERQGGGDERGRRGDIDAAPVCEAHSVIVINTSGARYLSADRPVCLPTISAWQMEPVPAGFVYQTDVVKNGEVGGHCRKSTFLWPRVYNRSLLCWVGRGRISEHFLCSYIARPPRSVHSCLTEVFKNSGICILNKIIDWLKTQKSRASCHL